MGITVHKIGKINEYTETFKCSCGHDEIVVTLGYKMERKQVKMKRQSPCLRCQLKELIVVSNKNYDKNSMPFCGECGCPTINGKVNCCCNQ
jgi:hypothetical protein